MTQLPSDLIAKKNLEFDNWSFTRERSEEYVFSNSEGVENGVQKTGPFLSGTLVVTFLNRT